MAGVNPHADPAKARAALKALLHGKPRARNGKYFWDLVDRSAGPDACWPWMGFRDNLGYGRIRRSGRRHRAQRWAYLFHTETELTRDEFVCHRCDNPPCCNPAHLYVGTHADNMRDRTERERTPRGSRNGRARMNDVAVRVMRFMSAGGLASDAALAAAYGVTPQAVRLIVLRRNWKHVA